MTERDSYAPGTPSWIDLGSPDPQASLAFYSALFGWEVAGAMEGYHLCTLKGRAVAGIGQAESAGIPWWTSYVTVEDATATAKLVTAAGGTVTVEPMDAGENGRIAVCTDPSGAPFSLWQPKSDIGAGLVNEHGALTWNELTTRDIAAAKAFYGAVFGWQAEDVPMGDDLMYTTFKLPGAEQSIAGGMPMTGDAWPADLADHWMVYFGSADCDATVAKAVELGGKICAEPMDQPGVGRFAVLSGPHDEVFSVITG